MSGQLNLFGSMSPALMPGDVVTSHGKELSFDDLLKRKGFLSVLEANGILNVCRIGEAVTIPGGHMYQRPRRRIPLNIGGGMVVHLFRADMKGDNHKRVYEL